MAVESPEPRWRIEMLGGLRVSGPGGLCPPLPTRRAELLLSYLVLHEREETARESIAALLWPESDTSASRRSLRTELWNLRRGLAGGAGVAEDGVAFLRSTRATLRLAQEHLTTDVAELEAAIRDAGSAARFAERSQAMERAVHVYRGELLPGHYDDWVVRARQGLSARWARALRDHACAALRADQPERALEWADRALEIDPLLEGACQTGMRAALALKDDTLAVRRFEAFRRTLDQQLGLRPDPETLELAATAGSQVTLARGVGASLRSADNPHRADSLRRAGGWWTLVRVELGVSGGAGGAEAQAALAALVERELGEPRVPGLPPGTYGTASPERALGFVDQVLRLGGSSRICLAVGSTTPGTSRPPASVLALLDALVTAARPGQVLCSHATAMLLERLPPSSGPGPLLAEVAPLAIPGTSRRERAFELVAAGASTSGSDAGGRDAALRLLETIRRVHPRLFASDGAAWLDDLARRQAEIDVALAWAVSPEGDPEITLRLATLLAPYWRARGELERGVRWLERALSSGRGSSEARGGALAALGGLTTSPRRAREAQEQAVALLRETAAPGRALPAALTALAELELHGGEVAGALAHVDAARAAYRAAGDDRGLAFTAAAHARALWASGRVAEALAGFEASAAAFRRLGDARQTAHKLLRLAEACCDLGDLPRARRRAREARLAADLADDPLTRAASELAFARIAFLAQRSPVSVSRPLQRARRGYEDLSHRWGLAECSNVQGLLATWRGQTAQAEIAHRQALAVGYDLALPRLVGEALWGLARSAWAEGNRERSWELAEDAFASFRQAREPVCAFLAFCRLLRASGAPIRGRVVGLGAAFRETERLRIVEFQSVRLAGLEAWLHRELSGTDWRGALAEGRTLSLDEALRSLCPAPRIPVGEPGTPPEGDVPSGEAETEAETHPVSLAD